MSGKNRPRGAPVEQIPRGADRAMSPTADPILARLSRNPIPRKTATIWSYDSRRSIAISSVPLHRHEPGPSSRDIRPGDPVVVPDDVEHEPGIALGAGLDLLAQAV